MNAITFGAATFLLATLVAGCLGAGPAPPGDDAPAARAIIPGAAVQPIQGDPLPPDPHDHNDPAQHVVERNIDMVAHLGGEGCCELEVQAGWLAQCGATGALLWNVSDPAAPALVSRLESGGCPDVKMTDDAEFAVVSGTQLWDLRDKAFPELVAEQPDAGCHMCAIHAIGGKEYLFSAANGPGMTIAEIVRDPPEIRMVGAWGFGQTCTPGGDAETQRWVGGTRAPDPDCALIGQFHDVYVYDDLLLNRTIAVPAYWDLGVWFVDVTDPSAPVALGSWADYQGESGDIHTTSVDFLTVDGQVRRIAVAASETGPIIGPFSTAQPSSVYVFDATDLSDIRLLARWVNPGMRPSGVQSSALIVGEFSTHNLQFEHGRIYLAHYHAGVWVLDVQGWLDAGGGATTASHVTGDRVPVLGVFNTRGTDGAPGQGNVWDVVLHQGFIYTSDEAFGLFVLHFQGDPRYDPAWTSDA